MILTISSHQAKDSSYYSREYPNVFKRFSGDINDFYQDSYLFQERHSEFLQFLPLYNLETFILFSKYLIETEEDIERFGDIISSRHGSGKIELNAAPLLFQSREEAQEFQNLNRVITLKTYKYKTEVFDRSIKLEVL